MTDSMLLQTGYNYLQSRMIALLLRHDEEQFRERFNQHQHSPETEQIGHYRDLAVLFHLRDQLFEHLIPRIIRRLSFASPNQIMVEEPPARGRVNWERTLQATWNERPGEAPLLLHSRVRRRDFATPENLLTIITLLEYQRYIRSALDNEQREIGEQAYTHPLHDIIERCERTLNFPQFVALRNEAETLLVQGENENLEYAVYERHNSDSAYVELLEWRKLLHSLSLLRFQGQEAQHTLGVDPKRDNYLYQLWIFYELVDLLKQQGGYEKIVRSKKGLSLEFTWQGSTYVLSHDQALTTYWRNSPGLRPDYYIRRRERTEIRDENQMIWHEPGYLLDAKYYKPSDNQNKYSQQFKRLLADLHLSGERYGALLYAYSDQNETVDQELEQLPVIQTRTKHSFEINPDLRLRGWQIAPHRSETIIHEALTALLNHVHQTLEQRVEIRCHASVADLDTHTPFGPNAPTCSKCGDTILAFCPKPHVSSQRIDRVCPKCDCLQNKQLCHIIGQDISFIPPRVQRVLTAEELYKNIRDLTKFLNKTFDINDQSEAAEQARNAVIDSIGNTVAGYVKLRNPDLRPIEDSLRSGSLKRYWQKDVQAIEQKSRDMLLAGEFIWYEVEKATIQDWAACAVQYLRAFENEMKRRIYEMAKADLVFKGYRMEAFKFTFGVPGKIFKYNSYDDRQNQEAIRRHIIQPNKLNERDVIAFFKKIDELSQYRNSVAHVDKVTKRDAEYVRRTILGDPDEEINGLLYIFCRMMPAVKTS
jgi:hypothetical protein